MTSSRGGTIPILTKLESQTAADREIGVSLSVLPLSHRRASYKRTTYGRIYYRHTSYRSTSHRRAFRRRASHGRALSTEMHGGTSGRKKEWSLLIYGRRGGGLYTARCSPAASSATGAATCSADL